MSIGQTIKDIRKRYGITQKQLAAAVGIEDSNLRKYESGRAKPKAETIEKFARALNVDPSVLTSSEMTSIKGMITLFNMFKQFRGELIAVKGRGEEEDTIYISFKSLNPFMNSWFEMYSQYQDEVEKAKAIADETKKKEAIEIAKRKYDKWIYSYPQCEPNKDMLSLMNAWDEAGESVEGMVLDEIFDKIAKKEE